MKEDTERSWWGMPLLPAWRCPHCKAATPTEDWQECRPYCEECGDHDGRRCPACGEDFDHVWGVDELVEAQKEEAT